MGALARREVAGRVLCDARAASCRCREEAGHYPATPHRCDPDCGGAWRGSDGGDDFEPIDFPGAAGMGMPGMFMPLPLPLPGLGFDEEW